MSAESMCKVCGEPSKLRCGSCHGVSYCSKSHQKSDWKSHKPDCSCYKVVADEKLGRHLIATRTITEGETIIKEPPIVAGPAQVTPPVCLGCHCLLSQFTARDCSTCGWPVCSETCEKSSAHRPECEITSQHKNGKVKINTFEQNLPHPSYQCLTVLRCLYMRKAQPELWRKLMELESHCKERALTVKYNSDQRFIAEFIPKFFNFLDFSSEEILKVAGIIQVNAHEVPLREPEYIAIYEKASFLEHNCKANCMKSFTSSGELVIRAAEKISQGDHLSICYTDPLWGREMRANHLLETKFFECQCHRCLDPTEFGTHFNSFKCTNRQCQGYFLPLTSIQNTTALPNGNPTTLPKCQKCGLPAPDDSSPDYLEIFEMANRVDKKSQKSCKDFLEKYKSILHSNHHLMVKIKLCLIDLLGWPGSLLSVPDSDLEWVLKTCEELSELTTKLIPAENRLRGLLLYHLQFAMRESDRRRAVRLECGQSQMREKLLERKQVLLAAYRFLSYEPEELPEGKMAVDAMKTLEDIDNVLKTQK